MRILSRYAIRGLIPIFFASLFFFAFILEMIDLVQNINRYIARDVPIPDVLLIHLYYLPKCISWAIPIAVIFAVAFCLGNLYANNELIAVFSSGISLLRFTRPIMVLMLFLSIATFFFQEYLVIDSLHTKTEQMYKATGFISDAQNQNVTLFDKAGTVVYQAAFYHDKDTSLQDLIILKRDDSMKIQKLYKADTGRWNKDHWILSAVDIYSVIPGEGLDPLEDSKGRVVHVFQKTLDDADLVMPPKSFKRKTMKIEELHLNDAWILIQDTKNAGLPYRTLLLNYYVRFSFALTPLVVAFLSASIGSRFRKNVLLLSLLVSLLLAVGYFVIQMIAELFARLNVLDPLLGAWLGTGIFAFLGMFLFIKART